MRRLAKISRKTLSKQKLKFEDVYEVDAASHVAADRPETVQLCELDSQLVDCVIE